MNYSIDRAQVKANAKAQLGNNIFGKTWLMALVAVLIETACTAIDTMKRLGIFSDAVHLQVSRSYELTNRTMFKPINPVYIIHGETTC